MGVKCVFWVGREVSLCVCGKGGGGLVTLPLFLVYTKPY